MLDLLLSSAIKSLDLDAIMQRPDVAQALAMLAQIARDFAAIRDGQATMLARLAEISARLERMGDGEPLYFDLHALQDLRAPGPYTDA